MALQIVPEVLQAEAFKFDTSIFAQKMTAFVGQALETHRSIYQRHPGGPV